MPLSEHEEALLAQMEEAMRAEDPKFSSTLAGAGSGTSFLVAILLVLLGFATLLAGHLHMANLELVTVPKIQTQLALNLSSSLRQMAVRLKLHHYNNFQRILRINPRLIDYTLLQVK